MLKIHRSDPQLIVQLRFRGRQPCGRFLRAYREGALRAALEARLAASLTLCRAPLQLELRAGAERLDALLADEERCLSCIFAQKVRRRDWAQRRGRDAWLRPPPHRRSTPLPSLTGCGTRNSRSWRTRSGT